MDTGSAGGKLVYHIFAAMTEFERNLIKERTAARARGRSGGRPEKLTESKKKIALQLHSDGKTNIKEICETLQVSSMTVSFGDLQNP